MTHLVFFIVEGMHGRRQVVTAPRATGIDKTTLDMSGLPSGFRCGIGPNERQYRILMCNKAKDGQDLSFIFA